MNKLPPPEADDIGALTALSINNRVKSYPHLRAYVAAICQDYETYKQACGDANSITLPRLAPAIAQFLKDHYASPNGDLHYIKTLRESSETGSCPLCGSLHAGQLDHLLPKANYPSLSIYSRNLVPACKCNGRKSTKIAGVNAGERILHPYFDECLSRRLLAAHFEDHGVAPRISLRIFARAGSLDAPAITFHVKNVVEKMPILTYLSKQWALLCRTPRVAIPSLKQIPGSAAQLRLWLGEERDRLDLFHGSRNNWNSIFVTGLIERQTLNWLFSELTHAGRQAKDPLEWR